MTFQNPEANRNDRDCISTLHEMRTLLRNVSGTDPLHKHITRYVVIVCSGAIEREFKSIIADFVSVGCSAQVNNYFDLTVRQSPTNPYTENIKKLLKKFDDNWASQFGQLINVSPRRNIDALKSLVDNRNQVAHGHPISTTFNDVVKFYCRSRNVIGILEKILR